MNLLRPGANLALTERRRAELAQEVAAAQEQRSTIAPLGEMSLGDAFDIQNRVIAIREEKGQRRGGVKLSFTAFPEMAELGASKVVVSTIFQEDELPSGAELELTRPGDLVLETEVVLRVGAAVVPTDDDSVGSLKWKLRDAVDGIALGFDLLESRVGWPKLTLTDSIADSMCSLRHVVGPFRPLPEEFGAQTVTLSVDGIVLESADTSVALGNTYRVFDELAIMMLRGKLDLRVGDLILTGALTRSMPMRLGITYEANIPGVEPCRVKLVPAQTAGEAD